MSREIKFRAWHPEAKDVVFFRLGESNLTVYGLEDNEFYTMEDPEDFPVMQYTGLNDSKGVEIYEGDIVKDRFMTGVVAYSDEMTCFHWSGGEDHGFIDGDSVEVIGNIHQNPELLEGS